MIFDFIIVGQGLCGTFLSRQLIKAGKTVLVIDNADTSAAGRVAGGIINPVTGKRLVRSWMIEELIPFAQREYTAIEDELKTPLLTSCSLLDFHYTKDEQIAFDDKKVIETEYLHNTEDETDWQPYFRFNYSIGTIKPSLILDLRGLLSAWRDELQNRGMLISEHFDLSKCEIDENGVTYSGHSAQKIIFCNGAACADNPYFDRLPWSKDKGEALIVSIPGLPRDRIYKQHISIVPWGDDLFWVGAAHDWKYTDLLPSPAYKKSVTDQLDYWLKLPYTVTDHLTALRPANFDRKPFIGFHPVHQRIGIFNGMGGKGCSMAPYFAHQFRRFITEGTPLMPDVDIGRYTRVLSKQ
jgi:glycine/D-amino acid oxidase-like deaminating enzyme